MGDLQVDLTSLQAAASELGLLMHEFDKAEDIASDAAADIGASDVAGAVHEFSSNWSVHRKDLLDSMQSVYKMVQSSHDTFVQADEHLAQDIQDATSGSSSGAAPARAGGPR